MSNRNTGYGHSGVGKLIYRISSILIRLYINCLFFCSLLQIVRVALMVASGALTNVFSIVNAETRTIVTLLMRRISVTITAVMAALPMMVAWSEIKTYKYNKIII